MFENNTVFREIVVFISLYVALSIAHNISSHLYYDMCVSRKWYEIFITPLVVETPQCKMLNWLQKYSVSGITTINSTMIILLGKIIMNQMNFIKKYK